MKFSNAIFFSSLIFSGNARAAESSSPSSLRGGNSSRGGKLYSKKSTKNAVGGRKLNSKSKIGDDFDGNLCKHMQRGAHCNHPGGGCTMLDGAYIHTGCSWPSYPEYYTETHDNPLTFGTGWYCNDGQDVKNMECDEAYISQGCTGDGQLVEYTDSYWQCKN